LLSLYNHNANFGNIRSNFAKIPCVTFCSLRLGKKVWFQQHCALRNFNIFKWNLVNRLKKTCWIRFLVGLHCKSIEYLLNFVFYFHFHRICTNSGKLCLKLTKLLLCMYSIDLQCSPTEKRIQQDLLHVDSKISCKYIKITWCTVR